MCIKYISYCCDFIFRSVFSIPSFEHFFVENFQLFKSLYLFFKCLKIFVKKLEIFYFFRAIFSTILETFRITLIEPFLGIILCQNSVCVVREFCQKCSLMDILRNRDLKLDSLFIASFVEDLIKVRRGKREFQYRIFFNSTQVFNFL